MAFSLTASTRTGLWSAVPLRIRLVVVATFAALVMLSLVMSNVFAHSVAVADDIARADERTRVAHGIDELMRTAVGAQSGELVWDESMRHAVLAVDHGWLDHEMALIIYGDGQVSAGYVVDPAGHLLHSLRLGDRPDVASAYPSLVPMVRRLMGEATNNRHLIGRFDHFARFGPVWWPAAADGMPLVRWAGALARINGHPAAVTVASLVPDHDPTLLRAMPNMLVSVRPLAGGPLATLAGDLVLDDARLADSAPTDPARNALLLLDVNDQTVGWLTWKAHLPGPAISESIAPLVALRLLLGLVVIGGCIMMARHMARTTRELVASEAQSRHNALHDALSGLPNRGHTLERLRLDLARAANRFAAGNAAQPLPAPPTVVVAFLDVDMFKSVNDTLGHHFGDELIRQVARRLRERLAPDDFVARFGGDEFVVLRNASGGRAAGDQLGRAIMALMDQPYVLSGHSVRVTASCGISWGPEHSEDPGELLRRADIALYRAKQRGRARYRCFTRDMDASLVLRHEMERELRRALTDDELHMAYQPIVDLATWRIEGFEALLRWTHPDRGEIGPAVFVPIAEQSGLMIELGNWMLRRVLGEMQHWPRVDKPVDVSVNLSPLQVMAPGFVEHLSAMVDEFHVDPRRIVLEITEGVMLDRSDTVTGVLRALQHMGFRIALDDFGTGYSSLGYLRAFQFDRIKIDRSFVQNIESDRDAEAILAAIVALGRTLRMKVVAEGVETEAQRHLVQVAGCDLVQGYLFWPALSAVDAVALLGRDDRPALRKAG